MKTSGLRWPHLLVAVAAVAWVAGGDRPLVDAVVVVGLALVAPLSLGHPARWAFGGASASLALTMDGRWIATGLLLPALAVAVISAATCTWPLVSRALSQRATPRLTDIGVALASVWCVVAVLSLMASTAELTLFDIREPIVRLTAVHYLYAGTGALVVATRLLAEAKSTRLGAIAVIATAAAPPIVAAGFVSDHPVPQIGGAVLMTVGVWASAALLLTGIRREPHGGRRTLRAVAGLAPWGPMVLAVCWAAAQHVASVPALSVPDMARVHGTVNGFGFVLLGLLATQPIGSDAGLAPRVVSKGAWHLATGGRLRS